MSISEPNLCRIACLGSHAASFRCLKFLIEEVSGAQVVAVIEHVHGTNSRGDQSVATLAKDHRIPVMPFKELESVEYDLGISFLFDAKIPPHLVQRPTKGFLNLHLGPLPRMRGSHSVFHALRLAREENNWSFGVTLMYIDEKLDTGPIIEMLPIPIFEDDTAGTLHARAMDAVPVLFEKHIQSIVSATTRVPSVPQSGPSTFYRREPIDHEIDLSWPPEKIYDMVRALSFPQKSRPFVRVGKYKIFLTLEEHS